MSGRSPIVLIACSAAVAWLGAVALPASAAVHYVDANVAVPGDGTSWSGAFADLQAALAVAATGDEIWVAGGVYRPSSNPLDRAATFLIPDGVRLYGGFVEGETDPSQRPTVPPVETVLDGDIAENDDATPTCNFPGDCIAYGGNVLCTDGLCPGLPDRIENSLHVVTTIGVGNGTLMDRFVIRGGSANLWAADAVDGGGWYNNAGSPRLVRCRFENNFAFRNGGGMFNDTGNPWFEDCVFAHNEAAHSSAGRGGGLYNAGGNPTLRRCYFIDNTVGHADDFMSGGTTGRGGGMHNGAGSPTLSDCVFVENVSYRQGGALYHGGGTLTMERGLIYRNWSDNLGGGGIWLAGPAVFLGTGFESNRTEREGGAVYAVAAAEFVGCEFLANSAAGTGGAVRISPTFGRITLAGCAVIRNSADREGGALYIERGGGDVVVAGSEFTENQASHGGAVYCESDRTALSLSRFSGNHARNSGGALHLRGGKSTVSNCLIDWNEAPIGGGVLIRGEARLENNTIYGNDGAAAGAGVHIEDGKPVINSCLIWRNTAAGVEPGEAQVYHAREQQRVDYSCVQADAGDDRAPSERPRFVDADGEDNIADTWWDNDYRLLDGSPCANMGDPFSTIALETDLAGEPRIQGCRVDPGAYESSTVGRSIDFDDSQHIDLADVAGFMRCMGSPEGDPAVTRRCLCVFDDDGDGAIKVADWAPFKFRLTGP